MGNQRGQKARGKGWKGYHVLWPAASMAGSEA